MKVVLGVVALLFGPACAMAQTVSDEALAECQSINARFTKVADCLPATDVAIAMLSVVAEEQFYGDIGSRLVSACGDLNDNSMGTWACVDKAISDAVELLKMVGSPDKIQDPLFQGISDPTILERVEEREDNERERFGDRMWGGSLYHPLR